MSISTSALHVAVAVIRDDQNRVLIAKRSAYVHQGNRWEFPGGKVETGETVSQALTRELQEELGITPQALLPLLRVHHHYPDKEVCLDVWETRSFTGTPSGRLGQAIRWVAVSELTLFEFPAANLAIIAAIRLPEYYLITPPPAQVVGNFLDAVARSIQQTPCLLQLRAKTLTENDYVALARDVLACCRQFHTPLLLNGAPSLLERVDAQGIHLTAAMASTLDQRPIPLDKLLSCSCHSASELKWASRLKADVAVLGPVQVTTSHPGKPALGWETFATLANSSPMPVYALGGMQTSDLPRSRLCCARGIAAIRGLWLG